jgi:hypothetical protein
LIGDVSAYAQLQAADAIRDSARNPGGGGAGVGIGVGLAMAQQIAGATSQAFHPAASAPSGPPPIPPSAAYFVAENGKPVGPLDLAALGQRMRDGKLRADTLVWRDGMAQWAQASQVAELDSLLKG